MKTVRTRPAENKQFGCAYCFCRLELPFGRKRGAVVDFTTKMRIIEHSKMDNYGR